MRLGSNSTRGLVLTPASCPGFLRGLRSALQSGFTSDRGAAQALESTLILGHPLARGLDMDRGLAPIHASALDPQLPLTGLSALDPEPPLIRLPGLDAWFARIPGLVSPLGLA